MRHVDDSERQDAHMENVDARIERAGGFYQCADDACGTEWNPGHHRQTRTDPGWVDVPECPKCGGPPAER